MTTYILVGVLAVAAICLVATITWLIAGNTGPVTGDELRVEIVRLRHVMDGLRQALTTPGAAGQAAIAEALDPTTGPGAQATPQAKRMHIILNGVEHVLEGTAPDIDRFVADAAKSIPELVPAVAVADDVLDLVVPATADAAGTAAAAAPAGSTVVTTSTVVKTPDAPADPAVEAVHEAEALAPAVEEVVPEAAPVIAEVEPVAERVAPTFEEFLAKIRKDGQ